jgi:hypothetical protein
MGSLPLPVVVRSRAVKRLVHRGQSQSHSAVETALGAALVLEAPLEPFPPAVAQAVRAEVVATVAMVVLVGVPQGQMARALVPRPRAAALVTPAIRLPGPAATNLARAWAQAAALTLTELRAAAAVVAEAPRGIEAILATPELREVVAAELVHLALVELAALVVPAAAAAAALAAVVQAAAQVARAALRGARPQVSKASPSSLTHQQSKRGDHVRF